MNTAYNNFYIVELIEKEKSDFIGDEIYFYAPTIDLKLWRDSKILSLAKVISASSKDYICSITGQSFMNGDIVTIDKTKIIHRFEDNTVLIRDDAIVSLYLESEKSPGAGSNEVVIKLINDNVEIEYQDITNGFVGTVVDINASDWSKILEEIKIGDKIVLVNSYVNTEENIDTEFRKLSIGNNFYVIADVTTIACKIN